MYNFITNSWENVEHQITFDVRQPKTQQHVIEKLKKWMVENPDTDSGPLYYLFPPVYPGIQ